MKKKQTRNYQNTENMGAPRKEVSWTEFQKLCEMQCTQQEIASFFDMTIETLNKRVKEKHSVTFLEYFKKYKDIGRISLRRKQHHLATNDSRMAIFLGKNYLGQSDKQAIELDKPIQLRYNLDEKPEIPREDADTTEQDN
jgi:hypothetical protein